MVFQTVLWTPLKEETNCISSVWCSGTAWMGCYSSKSMKGLCLKKSCWPCKEVWTLTQPKWRETGMSSKWSSLSWKLHPMPGVWFTSWLFHMRMGDMCWGKNTIWMLVHLKPQKTSLFCPFFYVIAYPFSGTLNVVSTMALQSLVWFQRLPNPSA